MNAEEASFTERIHGLALSAHEHDVTRVDALNQVRTKLRELNAIIDEATPHVVAEAQAVGTILYLTQQRLGIAVPTSVDAKRFTKSTKTLAVLLTAGMVSVTVAAGFPYKETTMAKSVAKNKGDASGYLVAAREAQIRKEWDKAATNYHHAFDCGSGAECSLGREAECLFYAGKYEDARATLDKLDKATNGETASAPYIRGLIAFAEKDNETAKTQFGMAEMAGDRRAVLMLKRLH